MKRICKRSGCENVTARNHAFCSDECKGIAYLAIKQDYLKTFCTQQVLSERHNLSMPMVKYILDEIFNTKRKRNEKLNVPDKETI